MVIDALFRIFLQYHQNDDSRNIFFLLFCSNLRNTVVISNYYNQRYKQTIKLYYDSFMNISIEPLSHSLYNNIHKRNGEKYGII